MKSLICSLVATASLALCVSSCAPQAYVINSQMRSTSKAGVNLTGKSISVVYLYDNAENKDSLFNASFANGFASRLEDDYYSGNQLIELFNVKKKNGVDYSQKDTLVNLVMDTGSDVVFLIDKPSFGAPTMSAANKVIGQKLPADSSYVSSVTIPFSAKVSVYSAMDKNDKVYSYAGSKDVIPDVYSDGKTASTKILSKAWSNIASSAEQAGWQAASSFLSTWKEESFYVIYYDASEVSWTNGLKFAESFMWKEAIDEWMNLLSCRNNEKKACAEYNIALGCFMTGQPALALEWLDRSDTHTPVSLSKALRQKIAEYYQ